MTSKYFKAIFLFVFAIGVLQGCKQQTTDKAADGPTLSAEEVVAMDSRGKEIRLPKVPNRVVALFDATVDDVFMLDAQDKLVGIPEQIYHNEDALAFFSKLSSRMANKEIATPTFGGRASNVEAIVGLQPDLVITFAEEKETVDQLENLNIPVFTIASFDQQGILDELLGIGTLLGKKERAENIVNYISGEIKKMEAEPIQDKKKAYYAWSKGRILSTSGKGTLMDLAIQLSGAENACPLEMQAPNVGAEMLYKWNPDLMILWNTEANDVYSLSELANLPAVVNNHVYVMKPALKYDPHTVKFLLFAKQVRHWAYPTIYTEEMLQHDVNEAMSILYKLN